MIEEKKEQKLWHTIAAVPIVIAMLLGAFIGILLVFRFILFPIIDWILF